MPVGFREGLALDEARSNWDGHGPRPIRWSAWYPAIDGAKELAVPEPSWFQHGAVARDAPLLPSERPYPLVMLSHGTGGVAAGLEWLGHRLARRGFVVLAPDHHGNNGALPYRAEGFLCLWERATDLSALLDDVGWRRALAGDVSGRASVAGFSAGAYTSMLLMGARVAHSQFDPANPVKSPIRGPREFPNLADEIPSLLERSAVFRESWRRQSHSFADARFDAALVMAPGRSVLKFTPQSLASIERPVRIAVGGADAIAPAENCSAWLHERVAGSVLEMVATGAGHYVFLPEPTPLGLREAPDVFADAPDVSRSSVHDKVALEASRLFAGPA